MENKAQYQRIVKSVAYYISLLKLNEFESFTNAIDIGEIDKESENIEINGEKKIKGEIKNAENKDVPVIGNIKPTDLNTKNIKDISNELAKRNIGLHELINDTFARLDLSLSISRDTDGKSWKITELNQGVPMPPPAPTIPGTPIVQFTPSIDELKRIDNKIIEASNGCNNLSTVVSLGLKNVCTTLSRNGDELTFSPFSSKFATATAVKTELTPVKPDKVYTINAQNYINDTKAEGYRSLVTWDKKYEEDPLLGASVREYDIGKINIDTKNDLPGTPKKFGIPNDRNKIYESLKQTYDKNKVDNALKNVLTNHVSSFVEYVNEKQKLLGNFLKDMVDEKKGAKTIYASINNANTLIKDITNKNDLLASLIRIGNKSYKALQFTINKKKYNYKELQAWLTDNVTSMKNKLNETLSSNRIVNKLFIDDKKETKESKVYIQSILSDLSTRYDNLITKEWQKNPNEKSDASNERLEKDIKAIQEKNTIQEIEELCNLYNNIYNNVDLQEKLLQNITADQFELIMKSIANTITQLKKSKEKLNQKETRPVLKYEKEKKTEEKGSDKNKNIKEILEKKLSAKK